MPWTAADAQKHDNDANSPAKSKKWARIANSVLQRTGDEAQAIRVANSKIVENTFAGRVLSEGNLRRALNIAFDVPERFGGPPESAKKPKKEKGRPAVRTPLLTRLKRAARKAGDTIFPRVDKPQESLSFHDRVVMEGKRWDAIKKAAESVGKHLSDIEQATSGKGERPAFTENPLAHIVHRAATYKQGREKAGEKRSATEKPKVPLKIDMRAKLGGQASKRGPSAAEVQRKIKSDTIKAIEKRRQKSSSGNTTQWSGTGDVVRPVQPSQAAQPFVAPPPKLGGSTPRAPRRR